MSRACDVRIAWPAKGLQTQTLRSRQSYRPTCGYLPLNVSVQYRVLTWGLESSGFSRFSPAPLPARFAKPNIQAALQPVGTRRAAGRGEHSRPDFIGLSPCRVMKR